MLLLLVIYRDTIKQGVFKLLNIFYISAHITMFICISKKKTKKKNHYSLYSGPQIFF